MEPNLTMFGLVDDNRIFKLASQSDLMVCEWKYMKKI
jgi:hypothetical protein